MDHFEVSHNGAGIFCLAEAITVTAVDSSGNPVTNFTGSITISTQTGTGDWSNGAGNSGAFSDATANDGEATYTYALADSGVATFNLTHRDGWGRIRHRRLRTWRNRV